MIPNRAPGRSWALRADNLNERVETVENDQVSIVVWPRGASSGYRVHFSRADARLLAKRINQCLDVTAKK